MTSAGTPGRKATPIAIAGRRVKRWLGKSLVSAPRKARKPTKHPRTVSDATISSSLTAVLLAPELKGVLKANEASQVIHDVFLPSETIRRTGAVSSGSSSSSSSSNGHTDGESVTTSTSPDEDYQEPPSLRRRHCDECRGDLGGNETCACVPDVTVVPPSPLPPPPRALSPTPSAFLREDKDTSSIHTSNVDQIPDEDDAQAETTEAKRGVEQDRTGDAMSDKVPHFRDIWGQAQEESQWGDPEIVTWTVQSHEAEDVLVTNEVEIRPPHTPPPAEVGDTPTLLFSSDGRMTLTLRNFLGAGSHGTVVSADWAECQRQVAIKVSHKLFISELDCTEPGLRNLKNELDVLKALKRSRGYRELGSNFFPELFKSWQDEKNVYFAMDLYPWNLDDLRWTDPNWDATAGDKILWTAEMILGVQALHRLRILHRDIKPPNVFISSTKHIVLGDYGLAHAWLDPFYANFPSSSLKARDAPGTMSYLAPEVVNGFYEDQVNVEVIKYAKCGFEADIWSLGVTICDSWCQSGGLFSLQEGEKHLDPRSAIPSKILQMDVQPAVEQIVGRHPIWHLITRMLDRNPKTRAGFKEILAHPVFAHLDWNRVAGLEYTPTWSFPEVEPSKQPKLIRDELEFPYYYQHPGDICVNDADSEQTKADKLDKQHAQVVRRAMGAARDWVGEQPSWIQDGVLGEYDFEWTAPEVAVEDEKWMEDD